METETVIGCEYFFLLVLVVIGHLSFLPVGSFHCIYNCLDWHYSILHVFFRIQEIIPGYEPFYLLSDYRLRLFAVRSSSIWSEGHGTNTHTHTGTNKDPQHIENQRSIIEPQRCSQHQQLFLNSVGAKVLGYC